MSDNLMDFSVGDEGLAREGRPLSKARTPHVSPNDESVPKVIAALSNTWLWVGIGLVSLWLMTNGG